MTTADPRHANTDSSRPDPPDDPHERETIRPITHARVERLQRTTGYPLVSILAATTPGPRMSPDDRGELDRLVETARSRLTLELDDRATAELIEPLRGLADQLTTAPSRHGLALFHGGGILEAYALSRRPDPRVVIDPTFATRDLVRDLLDNPPYRLVVLSASAAHLYVGSGEDLTERRHGPFPVSADDETGDRRGHLHQAVRTHANPRRLDSFLRTVDGALRADRETRDLPLVLAAAEPLASRAPHRLDQEVIGVVPGNHERTRPSHLARLARPVMAAHLARQRERNLADLERAASNLRAAFGVEDVWTAARDRRIVHLYVDPDYAQPATTTSDPRHITSVPDHEPPEVIDDAVDDIIEMVALHDGAISFVPLAEGQGSIAAVLRTRPRRNP